MQILRSLFSLCLALAFAAVPFGKALAQCSSTGATKVWNTTGQAPTGTYTIPALTMEFDNRPSLTVNATLTIAGTLNFDCTNNIFLHYDYITIASGGLLEIGAATGTIQISTKRLVVQSGGTLRIGTTTAPPTGQVIITLGGSTTTGGSPDRTLQVDSGGTLELHGYSNGNSACWTQLTSTPTYGSTPAVLSVAGAMNWNQNDKIVLASTDFLKVTYRGAGTTADPDQLLDQTEELTVNSVNTGASTVTCYETLAYPHWGGTATSSIDQSAEVGLLTRTIRIEGGPGTPGQVRFLRSSGATTTIHVAWTEFTKLGDPNLAGGGYPVHFHMMNDVGSGNCSITNSSLHHNLHNNLVIHETDKVTIDGNVFYDTVGWHIWFQDETDRSSGTYYQDASYDNVITDNLLILARENLDIVSNPLEPILIGDDGGIVQNQAGAAACVYIRSFNNRFEGNHAASSHASGFYVDTNETWLGAYYWSSPHVFQSFSDNVAHSCGTHGFYLTGYTTFSKPTSSWTSFHDCTAYKNNGFGLHCRAWGYYDWADMNLADNGNAVYFASAGRWEYEYIAVGRLYGGNVVGESNNEGYASTYEETHFPGTPRSLPSARSNVGFPHIFGDVGTGVYAELLGVSLYDGLVVTDGVTFQNFSTVTIPISSSASRIRKAGAFGAAAYASPWGMDPRNIASGCTIGTSAQAVYLRSYAAGVNGVNNTVVYDQGSGIVTNGGVVFPAGNAMLAQAGGTANTTWNALYLGGANPFGEVSLYQGNGTSGTPVTTTATVSIGSASQQVSCTDLGTYWKLHPWTTPLDTGSSQNINVVSFPSSANMSGTVTVMLTANASGSYANFQLPYTGTLNAVYQRLNYNDSAGQTAVTSYSPPVSNLWAATNSGYLYDSSNNRLYIRIKLVTTGSSQWSTLYGSAFGGGPVYIRIQ